jgi:hypothetical protein
MGQQCTVGLQVDHCRTLRSQGDSIEVCSEGYYCIYCSLVVHCSVRYLREDQQDSVDYPLESVSVLLVEIYRLR